MRSSRYSSLCAVVILVFVLTAAMEAEAIRPDAETRASVSSSGNQTTVNKPDENAAKGSASASSISETSKRSVDVAAREVRAVAHKLPEFHEDYYGPSDHSPRHH